MTQDVLEGFDLREAIDPVGLDLDALKGITYEEWEELGGILGGLNTQFRWAIGDWINFGEQTFAEKFDQAQHVLGLSLTTIRGWAWCASRIARVRRRTDVSWSKHEAVATLPPREQRVWLERIAKNGWTVEETRAARREADDEQATIEGAEAPARITVHEAARQVWMVASRDGEVYRVPVEAMLRLARAIGAATD
jgi:hypothetical protein